ncbi:MAG: pilus (MSHA type) biogenesis protein MshL [Deltaproteobacteria bacterium]|nr:pilus (MSHA type) biogenesis protein MshL [Deltaproteobacteria bacterium]
MNSARIVVLISLATCLTGCRTGDLHVKNDSAPQATSSAEQIKNESQELAESRRTLRALIEQAEEKTVSVEPVMPRYNPLEDHTVSFSMVDEQLKMVLYALAREVGMNLIIDPGITAQDNPLTLNFENVAAATVLEEVLNNFDLYYEIDKSIIRVKPFQERMFRLNFLNTTVQNRFSMGGDVLGAGDTESSTGLSGRFELTGEGAKTSNPYDAIEQMVKQVVSEKGKGGKYSINRLSGSLYIKDTPATVRAVAQLVQHFRAMLSRQILIEARIIEVSLSDEYQYGVDWSVLRGEDLGEIEINSAEWSIGKGLALSGVNNEFTLNMAVNALKTFGETKVVSNPTIRSKHAKPSLISVGTSFSYKKSVKTEDRTLGNDIRTETEVEVSTVFDGLILGVIPFIEEHGRISLLVNPIKSDVDRASLQLEDVGNGQSISLPQVNVKEISTTISLNSGDVIILGGLIDKRRTAEDKGFPLLSKLPWVGYLFKHELKSEETSELVIILSVTLV